MELAATDAYGAMEPCTSLSFEGDCSETVIKEVYWLIKFMEQRELVPNGGFWPLTFLTCFYSFVCTRAKCVCSASGSSSCSEDLGHGRWDEGAAGSEL